MLKSDLDLSGKEEAKQEALSTHGRRARSVAAGHGSTQNRMVHTRSAIPYMDNLFEAIYFVCK